MSKEKLEIDDLKKKKNEIRKLIRDQKSSIRKGYGNISYLIYEANEILNSYDISNDSPILNDILREIGDEIMRVKGAEKFDDLENWIKTQKGETRELITKIHSNTLFDNKEIPFNMSLEYLRRILSARVTKDNPSIYDEKTVNFIYKMGDSEFSVQNTDKYREIVENIIVYPLENDLSISQDSKIIKNPNIVKILLDYAGSYKLDSDALNIKLVIDLIEDKFEEYLKNLSPNDRINYDKRVQRVKNFKAFKVQQLSNDICSYSSFDEFMENIPQRKVEQEAIPPAQGTRNAFRSGTSRKDNVMSNDEKFNGIRNLVEHLRKKDKNIAVKNVLVGYQKPFKDYIMFPIDNTNLVALEAFNNNKGAALYLMDKDVVNEVLSIKDSGSTIKNNNAPSTRRDAKVLSGVVTVEHNTKIPFSEYEKMIFEAAEQLIANPRYNNNYKSANSKDINSKKEKTIKTPIQAKRESKNVIDKFGYDKLGINIEKVKAEESIVIPINTEDVEKTKKELIKDYKNPTKLPTLRLLFT